MSQPCPDTEQLRRLLADELPAAEAQAAEAHLEECVHCQEVLEQLTRGANAGSTSPGTIGTTLMKRLLADPPPADQPLPTRPDEPGGLQLARAAGRGTTAEIPTLLRQRLLFIAVVSGAAFAIYALLFSGFLRAHPFTLLLYSLLLGLIGGLAILLWRQRDLSIQQLRWIEILLLAATVLLFTRVQSEIFSMGWPALVTGQAWPGVWLLARSLSLTWYMLLVAYGLLIPNTWRRCTAVVGVMALWPVILNALQAPQDWPPQNRWIFVLETGLNMVIGAALAIYGSHRIEVLRKEASQARKLGPYQLTRRLGAGGMGEVWLAEHLLLRRPCAVKLIRPERLGDSHAVRRFEREVRVTATLSHPNTVEIYDYGQAADGTFYYAMEYLPGLSLQDLVVNEGPMAADRAVRLLRQVCGALGEAHAAGLVHRDIKPANILICERGGLHDFAKLLDFGLVRARGPGRASETLTEEGTIAGTPAYMSPEQARGSAEIDARSDLYSLGAVAYFLLVGQPPFVRDSAVQTLSAHLTDVVMPVRQFRPEVPEPLEAVVLRCLEKDPARRFQTAGGLDQALATSLPSII